MKRKLYAALAALLGLTLAWQAGRAAGPHHHAMPPAPQPGCKVVEDVTFQEVVRYVCKVVPDVKKRWVYDCIDDPFCIQHTPRQHGLGLLGHGCGKDCGHGCDAAACPNCEGPFCRKQLVKRQIEEECGTKCVIEKIVDRVPVT